MTDANFKLDDETVVPYPAKELEELRTVIQYQGVLTEIKKKGIATPLAVKAIAKKGTGKYKNVIALRDFVKSYQSLVRA